MTARAVTTILVAAVLVVCGWFVFAAVTGATLITFRTGSMSPTMPQGAVAVSMPVTAKEIVAGDVVTVQRPGEALPVTHRVVEVRSPGEASSAGIPVDARELVLQGDDNDTPDLRPYVVAEARRVMFAIPGLGSALMLLQSPLGMGTMTVLAGALATWAFWPRRDAEISGEEISGEEEAPGDDEAPEGDERDVDDGATVDRAPQTRRERRLAGIR